MDRAVEIFKLWGDGSTVVGRPRGENEKQRRAA